MKLQSIAATILLLTIASARADGTRSAIIDTASGKVVNIVEVNPGDKAPSGQILVPAPTGNIGDSWDGSKIIPKPSPFDPRLGY